MDHEMLLNEFGKLLMRDVRDSTLETYQATELGTMNAESLQEFHRSLCRLAPEDRALARTVVVRFTDEAIHNLLWMIESTDSVDLVARDEGQVHSLSEISDGLPGELYGNDGWISSYSKFKQT